VAITSFALHHLELDTYLGAAKELHRVLRPGGRFINADQFCRMLLQVDLLPRFMREDGEIPTTPDFFAEALSDTGFRHVDVVAAPPVELYNRVIVADS
jgi:ubiquinone/menaquinone biosynthesis C-methylase UbiE